MSDAQDMRLALRAALRSPDPSTQNGAVLVDRRTGPVFQTIACNEPPFGLRVTVKDWERSEKYQWVEHAERNAIYAAAKWGIATGGLKIVCPWAACADCARAIVQAGIEELVTFAADDADTNGRWGASIEAGDRILVAGGVRITTITVDTVWTEAMGPLRRDGQAWPRRG